jgi:hypothetical protein
MVGLLHRLHVQIVHLQNCYQQTAASLAASFTQTLISKLRELDGAPRTVAQIFPAMLMKQTRTQLHQCPYISRSLTGPAPQLSYLSNSARSRNRPADVRRNLRQPQPQYTGVWVLILKDHIGLPDVQEWAKYLNTNIPSGVLSADISVHGGFDGSIVLIMNLPQDLISSPMLGESLHSC